MPRTRDETIAQALRLLRITPIGEDAEADNAALVGEHFDACVRALDSEHDLGIEISLTSVMDDGYMPLARMVAGSVATEFGKDQYAGWYDVGLRQLTAISSLESRIDGRPVKTMYY